MTAQNFNSTAKGPLGSNFFKLKNQISNEIPNQNALMNHIGTGGSFNSKNEFVDL
jgi:hypothetical protein